MKYENIIGNRYGNLVVIDEIQKTTGERKRYYVKCICDCGNLTLAEKSKVKRGEVVSCGCVLNKMRHSLGSRFKKQKGEAALNETYSAYKKSAMHRGYPFELSKEEFAEIVVKPCIYCGREKTGEKKKRYMNGTFKYTGIDRYDNSKGYTVENSVPCCAICNRMKTNMTIEEFYENMKTVMDRQDIWRKR